jgi:hypothetical protein
MCQASLQPSEDIAEVGDLVGLRRRSWPLIFSAARSFSKIGRPLSSQHTASPSIKHERERRRANVSTISGSNLARRRAGSADAPVGLKM